VCSNRKLLIGFNDLATCFPDISYEAYGWNPSEILQNSTLKLNWQCSIGHVWSAKVNVRTQMMTGCPVCANQSVWQGYNDLATHAPDLAMEADGWDPSLVLKTSTAKKKWRCSLGHTWSTSVVSRVNRKWNCPYCSGQRVLTGFNDLTTCFPDLAMEADGWDPSLVLKTSTAKKKWRCSLGHTWLTQVQHRTRNKSGCPICSGREVLPGFNDLATTHPNLALEAEGWSPNSVVAGSDKKLTWKCQVGHVWRARVANRAILQRGCPSCSRTGYDPQKRGYLYLLTKSDYEVLQVGISNNLKNRLATHFSNGWKLLDTRGPMNGQLAFEVEQNILRYLDGNAISRGRAAFDEKFDGYTESWLSTDLTVSSLYELIKLVDDWEDKLQVEQLS
jgi:hypothetical protein